MSKKDEDKFNRYALLVMKGMLLDMEQGDRNKVLDLSEKIQAMVEEAGELGVIALTLANLEVTVKE